MRWKSSASLENHIDAERRGHDGSADGREDLGLGGPAPDRAGLQGRTCLAN